MIVAAIPLLILPLTAYVALVFALGGGPYGLHASQMLAHPVLRLAAARGGVWPVSVGDLLLAAGLIVSFIEMLKGIADRRVAIANHALSIALFIACLAAMLLAPAFATSTFFLLTLMALLDLVAGFIVTMGTARGGRSAAR